jgi:hypothetical protein
MLLGLKLAGYTFERILDCRDVASYVSTAMFKAKRNAAQIVDGVGFEIRSSLPSVASVRTRVSAARAAVGTAGTRVRSAATVIATERSGAMRRRRRIAASAAVRFARGRSAIRRCAVSAIPARVAVPAAAVRAGRVASAVLRSGIAARPGRDLSRGTWCAVRRASSEVRS